MNDIRLHLDKRPWLDFGWLRGVIGGITAGGLCILLVSLYFAYRQGRIEQATVADILSISPGGAADDLTYLTALEFRTSQSNRWHC